MLLSCGPVTQDGLLAQSAHAQDETVLRIGFMDKVDSLNPLIGMTDASRFFYSLVYDSMFSYDEDLNSVGDLVVDCRIVPETDPNMVVSGEPYGSVWEYDLTGNAMWHDGEPFTAQDAEWVLDLYAERYDTIWAYQPYTYFMQYAEVVDDYILRLHFYDRFTEEPLPVSYGDTISIPLIPRHMLSSKTTFEIAFEWNGLLPDSDPPVVGTGPFMVGPDIIDEFFSGDSLTLLRNPDHHWVTDLGLGIQFDKLVMEFFDDSTAMWFALTSGDIDVAQFPQGVYSEMKDDIERGVLRDIEVYDGLRSTPYWTSISFNDGAGGSNPARHDLCIRQAMAMAVDREYIVDTFYFGLADVGSTIISPVIDEWHYEPTAGERLGYDLEAAAQLLNDSGYLFTEDSPDVRVATADSYAVQMGLVAPGTGLVFDLMVRIEYPEERDIAAYLKDTWELIGVKVDYRLMTEARLYTEVYSYAYDLALMPLKSDPDPNHMLFCQSRLAWAGWNDIMYHNTTYEASYAASVSAMDKELRWAYVSECQLVHYLDVGHLVLAYPYQTYAWRTDTFGGWGDWGAHPGRSLDARWGVNPLLFELYSSSSEVTIAFTPYEREDMFTMMVPDSWTLKEDPVIEGIEFELSLSGPVHGNFMTNILLGSERVGGVRETREYLEQQMDDTVEGLSDMGYATTIVGTPIYWDDANYSALRFVIEWSASPVTQDMTIYADAESGMVWVLTCSVHSDWYGSYVSAFMTIATSLDVVEHESNYATYLAIVGLVAGVVAAAVVTFFLLRRRRMVAQVQHPPAYSTVPAGMCPSCGAQIPPGHLFCTVCGTRVGPPPPPG